MTYDLKPREVTMQDRLLVAAHAWTIERENPAMGVLMDAMVDCVRCCGEFPECTHTLAECERVDREEGRDCDRHPAAPLFALLDADCLAWLEAPLAEVLTWPRGDRVSDLYQDIHAAVVRLQRERDELHERWLGMRDCYDREVLRGAAAERERDDAHAALARRRSNSANMIRFAAFLSDAVGPIAEITRLQIAWELSRAATDIDRVAAALAPGTAASTAPPGVGGGEG